MHNEIYKHINPIYYNPPPRLIFSNYFLHILHITGVRVRKNGLTITLTTSPPTANVILTASLLPNYLAQNCVLDHYF